MKFLNKTARNILVLVVILILGGAMFGLVRGQLSTAQTAQEIATEVSTQTTDVSEPSPTVTIWPTSAAVPVTTEPYPIFLITPVPGPTHTPTPMLVKAADIAPPVIKVANRQQLSLDRLRPLSSMVDEDVPTYSLFEAVGWTEQGEVVLQEQNLIERDGAYFPESLYQVTGTWAVSPNDGKVSLLTNWTPSTVVVEGFMDSVVKGPMWVIHGYNNEGSPVIDWTTIPTWTPTQRQLANEWAAKKPITFPQDWYASSDGETVILRIRKDKIYILKPNHPEPIILPKDKGDIKSYITGAAAQLSSDGQQVAYGVRFDNPDIDDGYGRETDTYEIQISTLDGNDVVTIELDYEYSYPSELAWSPGEYIAFIAQSGDNSPLHLYVAKSDGSAVTDLTLDDFWAAGPLHWSRDGNKLIYTGGNPDKPESVGYWITTFSK